MSLDRALSYADLGWAVFPLSNNSKIPLPGSRGFYEASKDKEEIKKMWSRPGAEDFNIGVATGMQSQLVVLDVDVKNGSLGKESLKRINGLSPTLIASTPSGGWHYYYFYEKPLQGKIGFYPGLDFKAEGGYVVAPGSKLDEGVYEWVDSEHPVTRFPDVLLSIFNEKKEDEPKWKILERGEKIRQSGRNITLASIAGLYRWSGMSKDEISVAIKTINGSRCEPPLPDRDVMGIVNSINKYSPTMFKKDLDTVESELDDQWVNYETFYEKRKESQEKYAPVHMDAHMQLDLHLNGFCPGELITITGPTGQGKTLFAKGLAYNLLKEGLNVGFLSYEVPTFQIVETFLGREKGLPFYVPMSLKDKDMEWVRLKSKEAKEVFNCQVLFIDHLHFLFDHYTSRNTSMDIGAVVRSIKHDIAKRHDMIVFLIAHQAQPKDKEPGLHAIRDSSFIAQDSDTVLTVFRKPDTECDPRYPSYDEQQSYVKIDKARRSGCMGKRVSYMKKGDWLVEL